MTSVLSGRFKQPCQAHSFLVVIYHVWEPRLVDTALHQQVSRSLTILLQLGGTAQLTLAILFLDTRPSLAIPKLPLKNCRLAPTCVRSRADRRPHCMRNGDFFSSVMRAYRMGQLSSQAAYMSHSTPAAKALLRGAAGVKEPENSLNRLYEVVRAQQPHEGCPLSAQQVELICNVIGKTAVLTCKEAGLHS